MPNTEKALFQYYRYQILPRSRDLQLRMDVSVKSIDELIAKKNDFFLNAVTSIREFGYARTRLTHKIVSTEDNIIVIRLGARRSLKRSKRDFTEEELENWPNTIIILDNNSDAQTVAVQVNRTVFANTRTVIDILQQNINDFLLRYNLRVFMEPIFKQNFFWDVVDKYPNRIAQVSFELISPNMANISENLELDLARLSRTTNTKTTTLELNSDDEGALTLTKDDKFIASLVHYSSLGGGNIKLKVKGLTKIVHTEKGITEHSVDNVKIVASNPKQIIEALRELLKT